MDSKICSKCKTEKPTTEYYRCRGGFQSSCKQCHNEVANTWYLANKPRVREVARQWSHTDKAKEIKRQKNTKIRSTPKGKLNHHISSLINGALKKESHKTRRGWEQLVDFTIDQLKQHLEKQFRPGMTWENYGTVWHVDHKTPIAVFNFSKPDDIDFRLCWSLKNLQPLEAMDNILKGAKVEEPFQPSLNINHA